MYGCTVSGNTCSNEGAGLSNDGIAYLTDCTISGNSNDNLGGGVWNRNGATLDLSDCTISANNASVGGGLYNSGTATLVACTISGNTTYNSGAGIYAGSTLTLNNTIVAGNESAPYDSGSVSPSDIAGTSVSGSNDMVGTGGSAGLSSSTNLLGVADPGLAPLANNDGPTETMALSPGSLAIGAGSKALEIGPGGSPLTTDQRGLPLDTPSPDIGAYQTQPPGSVSFTDLTSPSIAYGTASVTISGILSDGNQALPDTESVQITLDSVTQSAPIGTGGTFSTTFDTSTLPASAAPYTVTYNYAGDAIFPAATTTSAVTVSRDTPTVNVTDSSGTYKNSAFDATATVTGLDGSPGSSLEGIAPELTYYAGITATGSPLSGAPTDAGTYTVVASFAGSTDYVANTAAPVTFTIRRATPSVSVTDAGGTYSGSAFGASATVIGLGGSPGSSLEGVAPVLTYYIGSSTTGASLGTNAPTTGGTYTVAAGFPGSADFSAVQSEPVTFMIGRASVVIALASSGSSAVYGQPTTFVATVAAVVPSLGTPTGTVTFFDGATALATVPLDSSGRAVLTSSLLAVGSHSITAAYYNTADFVGVKSGSNSESVAQAGTEVVLVPYTVFTKKQLVSVNLTAEIEPLAPGGGVPTGELVFELLTRKRKKTLVKTLGHLSVESNRATLTVKASSVLNKSITIVYGGNTDFRASTATSPKLTKKGLNGTRT